MNSKMLSMVVIALFVMTGCATYSNWTPTVDTYGYSDKDYQDLSRDQMECRELARQAAATGEETVKGAAVGGLVGAAAGAAIGAAVGHPGTGAAVGAASGGIGGGTLMGVQADQRYKDAYASCMRQRGHKVVY